VAASGASEVAGGGGSNFFSQVTVVGSDTPGTALIGGFTGGGTETITSGTSFGAGATSDQAVVGTALATKNNLTVGSTFTAWDTKFSVVGIYTAGSSFADADVLMPLATVQKLTDEAGEASNAVVTVDTAGDVTGVQTAISSALGSSISVINTSQNSESNLTSLSSVQSTATYLLVGTVIGAALILLLTMLMIVRERRREIGVLKALGAPSSSIVTQFVAESVTFTFIASVIGFLAGLLFASPIASALLNASSSTSGVPGGFAGRNGFTPPPGGGFGHFGGRAFGNALTQLHTSAGWSTIGLALLIAVAVAVVGSSVAVATIVRIRPAEVLRSE
jgi:putative ABC transport system permease protein